MAIGVALVLAVGVSLTACPGPGPAASPLDKAAALCVSHRTAKLLACTDIYSTRPEIDACKAVVMASLDCTKDAGADAAPEAAAPSPVLVAPAVHIEAGADQ